MATQQKLEPFQTKILDVFRSKSASKSGLDIKAQLMFKIKPERAKSQLIVYYKDLRDNFPYALIDYYESKITLKKQSFNIYQQTIADDDKNKQKSKSPIIEGYTLNRGTQLIKQQIKNKQQKTSEIPIKRQPVFDYDAQLQKNGKMAKPAHVLLSDSETNQNRYLRDLNNDQNNMKARRKNSNQSNYEKRKKKKKI